MKKYVVRVDDVGYTKLYNEALWECFDNGIGTSADVMADCPGSVEAMEKLRDYPWISVGWHTHMWGSPVLPPEQVPSLYDPKTGHFRVDLKEAPDVVYEEALAELRAQMDLFKTHYGKAPDTCCFMGGPNCFGDAMRLVCEENGVALDYYYDKTVWMGQTHETFPAEKWADRKIHMFNDPETMRGVFPDSISEFVKLYDPVDYYLNRSQALLALPDDEVVIMAWHPGCVDYYVSRLGDQGAASQNFLLCRPLDLHALCSDEVKQWIQDRGIELVNQRDALYGTSEYQDHLKGKA